ncbi:MAG: hypothetical protein B9S32_00070 [Verrucomicrobia bacterium Tous-C9LFEB]|nr:MAG: hypothetical protein B9S32_00070 [Verrucomicrobia bacterium Tous-C9LFEB]
MLLFCALLGLIANAPAEELKLGRDVTVVFNNFGAIENVTSQKSLLLGKCVLTARSANQKTGMFQDWSTVLGNKVKCELNGDEMEAVGALVLKESPKTPQIEFKVKYKKKAEGVLSIQVEATLLQDDKWVEPLFFHLLFPTSIYQDAVVTLEATNGTEKSYTIGAQPLDMRTYGSRKVTVTKGSQKIVVTPSETTQVSALDGRAWGGAYIRVDCGVRRSWAQAVPLSGGQKEEFEVTVAFTSEE